MLGSFHLAILRPTIFLVIRSISDFEFQNFTYIAVVYSHFAWQGNCRINHYLSMDLR